jgi:hypothetical protein
MGPDHFFHCIFSAFTCIQFCDQHITTFIVTVLHYDRSEIISRVNGAKSQHDRCHYHSGGCSLIWRKASSAKSFFRDALMEYLPGPFAFIQPSLPSSLLGFLYRLSRANLCLAIIRLGLDLQRQRILSYSYLTCLRRIRIAFCVR